MTKAEIQRLRDLKERKHRQAQGRFVVEGEKVVHELLAGGFPLEAIYATDEFQARVPVHRITPQEMERISHFPTPSPVLAVGRIDDRPLAPGAVNHGLTLALDGVQDPGNVGTLIRIADWFGLARLILSPDSADRFSQKTINASMGSFARVAAHVAELPPLLSGASVPVLGCDLGGDDARMLTPVADAVVVIGNEGRGLSPAVRATLKRRLTIRRRGQAESLNAAVAAGIIIDRLTQDLP